MISMSTLWRWAESQERALVNARTAATECSRRRVERAEVEAYLAGLALPRFASSRTGEGATAQAR